MLPPDQDESDRRPIWDALQEFWLDTDPGIFLPQIAERCASSKYSIDELEQIFWNEVRPALYFNLLSLVGEWAGFESTWLSERISKKHRYGKPVPVKFLDPHSNHWWKTLKTEIERIRSNGIMRTVDVRLATDARTCRDTIKACGSLRPNFGQISTTSSMRL